MGDHCRPYALSCPDDKDYQSPCDHEHTDRCDRCDGLATVIAEIQSTVDTLDDSGEKDELKYEVEQSVLKIRAWKAHILRAINQDQARINVIQILDPTTALLVLDWAMKYLPKKYREAQSDWFGKRGISWHVTVALRKNADGTMQTLTFLHVFEKCSQVSDTVLAIIDDVFSQLKSTAPEISTVYLRQDNAGCYHSAAVLLSVQRLATKNNLNLAQVDYSDPQGGKGSCDRKAANVKNHIRVYLNEGHDVETAQQMVEAINSAGGVPGVRVTLCGQQITDTPFPEKLDGISLLNNVGYSKDGITVWKAYSTGPGKTLPLSMFSDISSSYQLPQLNTEADALQDSQKVTFTNVKARKRKSKSKQPADCSIHDDENESGEETLEEPSLFFCPEAGCVKSYQKLSSLEKHLDYGTHKYALERETLYDKAMLYYAAKLEEGASTDVPTVTQDIHVTESPTPVQPMGWALKSTKQNKRFSKKQKEYLLDIYNVGENTGQKADPASVSRAMRKARLPTGEPVFNGEEYLSTQQIAGFFSRVTAKKKVAVTQVTNTHEVQKDRLEIDTERLLSDLHSVVSDSVSIRHPIMYSTYNLCEYVSKKKLDRFSILVLKDICNSFQLDTCNVTLVKRKKPYITLIELLVAHCSCQTK